MKFLLYSLTSLFIIFIITTPLQSQEKAAKIKTANNNILNFDASSADKQRPQLQTIESSLAQLNELLSEDAPGHLPESERDDWRLQTKWVQNCIKQIKEFQQKYDNSSSNTKQGKAAGNTANNMMFSQMSFNVEFLALQNSLQKENHQFQMLSIAMKVRHDAAMRAIRNLK